MFTMTCALIGREYAHVMSCFTLVAHQGLKNCRWSSPFVGQPWYYVQDVHDLGDQAPISRESLEEPCSPQASGQTLLYTRRICLANCSTE